MEKVHTLADVYKQFTNNKQEMEGRAFSKMMKDSKLIGNK